MTNLGGLKLAEGGGTGGRWRGRRSKGGGVGIEDLDGVVAGGAEVRTVIGHKVRVCGHGKGVLFHGGFHFEDVMVHDGGVLEHGG